MGHRLHFAQHFDPKWEGGMFNRDQNQWDELFYAKFWENGWYDESNAYEVYRDDVKAYIEEIRVSPEVKNEFIVDYTNEQVADNLEEILTSDDDNIRIEWF